MAVIEVEVYDAIEFVDSVATTPRIIWVRMGDYLRFTESEPEHGHSYVRDQLVFTELVGLNTVLNRGITHTLGFQQDGHRSDHQWFYQNLTIAQSAIGARQYNLNQTLAFIETPHGWVGHDGSDNLGFTETVNANVIRTFHISDTLTFTASTVEFVNNPVITGITTPSISHTVTLTTAVGTMTLPAPDFNNTEDISEMRINRKSMGGTFIIYHAPFWPTSDEFTVAFSYLSEAQVLRLRQLVEGAIGKLCTFVDHESVSRQGIITTPDLQVSQKGRRNYTAGFKFITAS